MRSLLRTGLLLLPLLAAGCDHIEYHPYDTDISGEQDINAKNIARIEAACRGRQTVRFAMISDTQRWYDETEKAVEALNARDDIDFVLHGGDLSDFGLKKEFMWQRDILNRLRVPYVCLLGNHDCQGTGEAVFEKIFGPSDFAFTAADVRFVCLNTNAMEYDYSHPVPDFDFLEHEYGSSHRRRAARSSPCTCAPTTSSSTTTWPKSSNTTSCAFPSRSAASSATNTAGSRRIFSATA